jgi:hypothetical protein
MEPERAAEERSELIPAGADVNARRALRLLEAILDAAEEDTPMLYRCPPIVIA